MRTILWVGGVVCLCACQGSIGGGTTDGEHSSPEHDGGNHLPSGDHDSSVPVNQDGAVSMQDGALMSVDAGHDGGSTPTPGCAGAVFCDDFEGNGGGAGLGSPWSVSTHQGSVSLSTDRHVSGSHAVHVVTNGGLNDDKNDPNNNRYQAALIRVGAPYFPVTGNHFFGRVYVWLKAAPSQNSHWTMIQGSGPYSGYGHSGTANVRYGGMITQRLMANYDTSGASTDCATTSARTAPEEQWNCVEWEFDGTTNTMHYWIDGQAINDMTIVDHGGNCNTGHDLQDHWVFPNFQTLSLGWEHYQVSDPIDMYLDDVAIGTSKIGCQ